MEHFIKEPEDIRKLLSVPYEPFPFSANSYIKAVETLGEDGIVMFGLDHAGYALQRMAGSETFGLLSVDERELVDGAVSVLSDRIKAHAKAAIEAGLRPVFSWVGPELLIPPLMGYTDFEDFCFKYDKPLCDMIHNAKGYVWVHCHGKVARLLDRFIAMGVDVLNPLEPPKNGDVGMEEIALKYKGKIGLEGNIEIQELLQAPPERLKKLISDCVSAGAKSGRFILCPSAGFMEYPFPEQRYIDNLMLYLSYGLECVENAKLAK
jgi:uroporphyrinogen-III decarboxylase